MKLIGKKVLLRQFKISDTEFIRKCAKNKEITKYTLVIPPPFTTSRTKRFIKESQKEIRKKIAYRFAIEFKETNQMIGMVSLKMIDWKNKNANVGFWLSKKYWGRGLAKEALYLILKSGFKKLKLERIQGRILHKNTRAQKLLERAGFKLEGRLRKKTYFRNKWYDDLMYGLLKEEYRPRS